ncbi:SDR family NAD(P)-dependent oxidoreductase [Amycolatopsis acidicola]|uniref:SDR family NAD(P)-dependent oxidoreductase n=1 Tax=Amycolatopsis acidicola TaxID=2596893 RepID=A0A5N0USR6_9PSEU|nr:SDR family NAD(P)-dependent oxidoreductase [Amycolatopsis acidicola]KAA9152894.1 SDR family NAD(P)-dependent oxidoreductase [Amycolatopsis acidicola]
MTGASKGIGEAIARRLAAQGVDLVIVARDRERLDKLAAECAGVSVEVLDADLADPRGLAKVEARLAATPPVDLLVNNAGYARTGAFKALPVDNEASIVALNVTALLRLTHAAVGAMTGNGGGAVVNISSMAGLQPYPRMATYAATKAFVNSFTEAVHEEAHGSGVTATTVLAGFVRTDLSAGMPELRRIPPWLWITPDAVASAALAGAGRGKPVVVPSLRFRMLAKALALLPRRTKRRAVGRAARRAARLLDGAA